MPCRSSRGRKRRSRAFGERCRFGLILSRRRSTWPVRCVASGGSTRRSPATARRPRIQPDFIAAHIGARTALRLQRRSAESEQSCRQALAIDANSAAALTVLAELRADAGRFAEAQALYERVISTEPESPDAWAGIAHLRRMTPAIMPGSTPHRASRRRKLPPRRELFCAMRSANTSTTSEISRAHSPIIGVRTNSTDAAVPRTTGRLSHATSI